MTTDEGGSAAREARTAATLTVRLPPEVADYLRSRAEELQEPVSGFVANTIRIRQALELEQAMNEGRLDDSHRDQAFADDPVDPFIDS